MTAKKTIEDYLDQIDFPNEIKRMMLKEIYDDTRQKALDEAIKEANAREVEKKDGCI